MIGVGWVTSVGSWLQQAGPLGAALAFLIGGALMLCIELCYAEATPMLPVSGGEVAYSYAAFGTGHAFMIGWCLAFGCIAISAFEAISVGRVLGFLLPDLDQAALYEVGGSPVYVFHLRLAGVFTVAITVLQYRGVAGAECAQRWVVIAFTAICLVFIVASIAAATAFTAAFGSPLLARLMLVAVLLGLFTSWNGFFLAGSRVLFALGRGTIISSWFGETHPRFGTPHRAVLVTGALTLLAPFMGRDALLPFVNAGSFFIAIAFMGAALSVRRLRRSAPGLVRPFKMAGGDAFPILATAGAAMFVAAMIIPRSPAALAWPREIAILGLTSLVAIVFWFRARRRRTTIAESQRAFPILEQYAPVCRPGLFQSRPTPSKP